MKGDRHKKKIIEELAKRSNIQLACNKVGISRQTFYRWCQESNEFNREVEEALIIGDESVNDLMEGKGMQRAQDGYWPAIKHFLDRRHPKFNRDLKEKVNKNITDLLKEKLENARKRDINRTEDS